jgi:hypothetical protein
MSAVDHGILTTFLLALFWFVLSTGLLAAFFVVRWCRNRQLPVPTSTDGPRKDHHAPAGSSGRHPILKRPDCWLAIKNRNLMAVQSALGLHNPKPCTWSEGLSGSSDQKLFISPPVSGWILVIGPALPDPSDDVDICHRFLMDLSRKVGHVQFFNASGILNHHAWIQIETGRVHRAYAWAGRTLWNEGKVTQAEKDLGLKCFDYAETVESNAFGLPESIASNLERVHLLASRWSLDPDEIDERYIDREWGIVGEPSRRF